MTIDLTQIILAIITLIGAIISRYLIPMLKDKLDERKYDIFNGLVRVGVYAAEQLYNSDQGKEKKEYVLQLLKTNGYEIDTGAVDALIEAINAALAELIADGTVKALFESYDAEYVDPSVDPTV